MSLYKNIDVDFVARTKENLDFIEQQSITFPQEVTLFLNMCYGLLVLPQQKIDDVIARMHQELSYYGIGDSCFMTAKEKTLKNFIRSLRNGFAHGHLQSLSLNENDDFSAIMIKDYKNKTAEKNNNPHTTIELSLTQLKDFMKKFSCEYLHYKQL